MRIALFGEILEHKVISDLHNALVADNHDVLSTGPVWKGHLFPPINDLPETIDRAIHQVNDFNPDLIVVIRQSALRPSQIKRLRAPGRKIFVWLPDDPVLYRVYAQSIDEYDLSLHCGGAAILRFYDKKGHKPGVNFPFWADEDRLPYTGSQATGPVSAAFFGLLTGRIKADRADRLLAIKDSFPGGITIYGRGNIPHEFHDGGYLDSEMEMRAALSKHHVILNVPQVFSSYMQTRWAQPEFPGLGYFEIPSRVVQMAALGLPILTIAPKPRRLQWRQARSLAHPILETSDAQLTRFCRRIENPKHREKLQIELRRQFEKGFTAKARAKFLLHLFHENGTLKTILKRSNSYLNYGHE